MGAVNYFLDLTDSFLYRRAMVIPADVAIIVTRFVCKEIKSRGLEASAAEIGKEAGQFIMSQVPMLIAVHALDEVSETELIAFSERIGKGFATVLLEEKGR